MLRLQPSATAKGKPGSTSADEAQSPYAPLIEYGACSFSTGNNESARVLRAMVNHGGQGFDERSAFRRRATLCGIELQKHILADLQLIRDLAAQFLKTGRMPSAKQNRMRELWYVSISWRSRKNARLVPRYRCGAPDYEECGPWCVCLICHVAQFGRESRGRRNMAG